MAWSSMCRARTWVIGSGLLVLLFGCNNADHQNTSSDVNSASSTAAAPATSPAAGNSGATGDEATKNATRAGSDATSQASTDSGHSENVASDTNRAMSKASDTAASSRPGSNPLGESTLKHLADISPNAATKQERGAATPSAGANHKADTAPTASVQDKAGAAAPESKIAAEKMHSPAAAAPSSESAAAAAATPAPSVPEARENATGAVTPGQSKETAKATATAETIAEEPLFAGWPTPQVALVLTGRQHGYLEPCGCAGLDRQKGGLIRRYSMIKQLRAKGWSVIPIDAGNQVRRFGRQAEIKYQMTIEGLKMMDYKVVAFGPDDLRLSAPDLFAIVSSSPETFVSANVAILDPSSTSPYRVISTNGKKIGVTAVLGARNQKRITAGDITIQDAKEALQKVWPQLQNEHCDLNVLICHGTIDESKNLGKQFPGFQIVITTGGAGEPRRQPEQIEGTKAWLIEVGTKGMFAGVVGLFDDAAMPLRYQRVPLDARFHDTPEMLQLLAAYQDQLKAAGLAGLGIRPQPSPNGMKYIGSETCQDCHPKAYKIWKQGRPGFSPKHSVAYQTLLTPPKRANVPRNYDPECISCHVIGWNPQQYYPYESGYLSLEETPKLINVGCEDCHGPGATHVAAENGDVDASDQELERLRKMMRLPLKNAEQKCLECHDLDNSPDFQAKGAFEKYWEKIKH